MNNNTQPLIIGAVLGSLLGAAAVLLSTPLSGAKMRSKILNGLPHEESRRQVAKTQPKRKKAQAKGANHKHVGTHKH